MASFIREEMKTNRRGSSRFLYRVLTRSAAREEKVSVAKVFTIKGDLKEKLLAFERFKLVFLFGV